MSSQPLTQSVFYYIENVRRAQFKGGFKHQEQPFYESVISSFNLINQPDAANSQVYYLSFKYSSTCFRHPHAHHQKLQQLQ
jgi:hypothetical protein